MLALLLLTLPACDVVPPLVRPGADWVVDCGGRGDFVRIQDAIDVARSGDRIAVEACTYHECIDYRAKVLDIYGTDGSGATVIDGDLAGTVVRVVSGESLDTRLAGVTIRGGYAPRGGSAIEVRQSSLLLEDVVLENNGHAYAVLHAADAFVTVIGLTIADNDVRPEGMGIYSVGGGFNGEDIDVDCDGGLFGMYQHNAATLDRTAFNCAAGHALFSSNGELRAWRSAFTGGITGLYVEEASAADTSQRTMISNVLATGATGMDIRYMTMEIANSVISGTDAGLNVVGLNPYSFLWNSVVLDSNCGVRGDGGSLTVYYSDFWNNADNTCSVTADTPYTFDPMFVDYPTDLDPGAGSGLIDAGEPAALDTDGTRSDIGAFGGPLGAWR